MCTAGAEWWPAAARVPRRAATLREQARAAARVADASVQRGLRARPRVFNGCDGEQCRPPPRRALRLRRGTDS